MRQMRYTKNAILRTIIMFKQEIYHERDLLDENNRKKDKNNSQEIKEGIFLSVFLKK